MPNTTCPECGVSCQPYRSHAEQCPKCGRIQFLFSDIGTLTTDGDAEPITAEWWCEEVPGVEFIDISTVDTRFNIGCDKDGVFFSIIESRSGYQDVISLPAVRTRGDVRQLVRLLGRE